MKIELSNIKYSEEFIKEDPNMVPETLIVDVDDSVVEEKGKQYAVYQGLYLKYGKPFADGIIGCDMTPYIERP